MVQAGLGFDVDTGAALCLTVAAEVAADIAVEIAGGTELEARVEIRQLEELEVFDSLRLSVVVAAEILAEVV